jgi:hypothetical protein
MQANVREGFLRVTSCLTGLLCGLLVPSPAGNQSLYDSYTHGWNMLAVGGWGALACLVLSRLVYQGSWSSYQPGPPRGFPSSRQVSDLLRTILGCLCAISLLAVPMARNADSIPYSLLSAGLAFVLWSGLQRWEVSTPSGVKAYRTFLGLQWLARDSNPTIHWETPNRPVGRRSDQEAFSARHQRARWLGLVVALSVAAVLVLKVFGAGGNSLAVLAAGFYAPIPFYLVAYRLFYLVQPSGVSNVLGKTPQPRSRENPLLPEARPPDRRGCILVLLAFPPTWVLVFLALGLISLPSLYVAEVTHLHSAYLGFPWVVWALVKLVEGRRSYFWHEVDLTDLSVFPIEVRQGYQFAQTTQERRLRAVGVTNAPQGMSKFVPVLYFEDGGYLPVGEGEEQSWAWEIACRLAQKALVPAISPRTSVLTAEVSGWIRSGAAGKLTEWVALKESPPDVSDQPPVD